MKENKLSQSFQKLKNDLAPMSWAGRIEHIFTYYKETLVIAAVMLIIVIYLASRIIGGRTEILMGGLLANVELSEEGEAYISSQYFEKLEGNDRNQEVNLAKVRLDDLKNEATMEMTYYTLTQTIGMLTAQEIDYLMMDKTAMELYIAQETFLDLRKILPAEVLEAYEGKIIHLKTVDEEGKPVDAEYPIALDISELPFVQDCVKSKGPVYLGVAANAPNLDSFLDFWQYLNSWKDAA